ncbi:MAG: bifunctional DNA-formamidopyrimidine glycosylase/DNA-(apurinic or apyrimidinic site) lyase, partial [Actinobacteria bacterium]|nr:bifunctional DNA-formamidopyrimidine glycosylase/DNA-(apurinic or apyrimidinic site) lyase [Actinomycetota bacterium]
MPELPEVEIVRRRLDPRVVGRTIVHVAVADAAVSVLSEAELARRLVGRRVVRTGRRGKWLLLEVGKPQAAAAEPAGATPPIATCMVVHLRMTGRLLFEPDPTATAPPRFTVRFDDGSRLLFYDVRRFGGLWAVPADETEEFFAGLGVEPLGDELTVERLRSLMSGRRAPLKSFLLDQRHVAGIGNIYADEALFRARLHPLRPAGSVGPREAARLHGAIRATLQLGIDHEGSSVESFVDPAGGRGHFQEILNVYQRTGRACRVCGTPIRRLVVGGRGTHYCPRCQPRRHMRLRTGEGRRQTGTAAAPSRLYVVAARLPRRERLVVAAHDDLDLARGWYAYVGSAQRGRQARVARHMRAGKPLRWHADYLFSRHPATRAWSIDVPPSAPSSPSTCASAECALADALVRAGGARPAGAAGV